MLILVGSSFRKFEIRRAQSVRRTIKLNHRSSKQLSLHQSIHRFCKRILPFNYAFLSDQWKIVSSVFIYWGRYPKDSTAIIAHAARTPAGTNDKLRTRASINTISYIKRSDGRCFEVFTCKNMDWNSFGFTKNSLQNGSSIVYKIDPPTPSLRASWKTT